jgi:hypothetical protein
MTMSDDDELTPERPAEQAIPPSEESPFATPEVEEIGKSYDPSGIERRDG